MRLACGETIVPGSSLKGKVAFLESAGYDSYISLECNVPKEGSLLKDFVKIFNEEV